MITASNYVQEIKRIGINILPDTLQKSYEFFNKATSDYTDLHRIQNPGKIKDVWGTYLNSLNEYAGSLEKIVHIPAPKVKAVTKVRVPKVKAAPKVKVPKVKPTPKEKPAPAADTHIYSEIIPIEVRFIKSYLSMDGRQKTRTQLLGFLARLQKAIREHHIRATSKFAPQMRHIQKEMIGVINSLKNENAFTFELDKKDEAVLRIEWKDQFTDKYRVSQDISIIKRFINLQGKTGVKDKAKSLLALILSYNERNESMPGTEYSNERMEIEKSLSRYIDGKDDSIQIREQSLNGLLGIVGLKKKSNLAGLSNDPESTTLGFLPELATNVVASFLYDKAVRQSENTADIPVITPDGDASPSGTSAVIPSAQLRHMLFTPLGLTGEWKTMLGNVAKPFAMMVYGKPGSGKSTFNLIFAKYLAQELNKKVLIVSGEEGFSATMKEKFERLQVYHPNIFLSGGLPASFDGYDIVFIDSVNHLQLSEEDLKLLLAKNLPKGISFVFVFHSTKEGNYRGVTTFEHLVDISMKVEGGVTSMGKNRFGGSGTMKVY